MRSLLFVLLALAPLAQSQGLKFAADRPLDLLHVKVEGDLDLKRKRLDATATLDLTALRPTAVIALEAHRLTFSKLTVLRGTPHQPAPHRSSYDGEMLEIVLEQPLVRGETARVVAQYACVEPDEGLYFFGPTSKQPDVPYQVWSQGETHEAHHWIPIIDSPAERITSELIITVDAGLKVLSNGARVSVDKLDGGKSRWHWRTRKTHVPYLITLVVGDFAVTTETWRGKTVDYWVPPGRKADTKRSFQNTTRMLETFSEWIGVEYPWEKYSQIVVEQFSYGGMENTSATTLTERTLHDERASMDTSSDGLVAHELAHQWFGDLLTCRDWAHTWLNEGFATYFEALWMEHDLGRDEFLVNMRNKARSAIRGGKKLPIVHRAYRGPWEQFDARAYPKGAWVLHMIRRELGDETWWRAVNHYVTKYQYTCVETHQFRRALEESTGRSFERFFHDWTMRPGNPSVRVAHRWDAKTKLMEVHVRQTQKDEAFHFPLRLEYQDKSGSVRRALTRAITSKDVRFYVPLNARPGLIRVDPETSVLMELSEAKGRDFWLAQLQSDTNVLARIRAAEHFGGSRRAEDRKALADALLSEPFWGVAAEIARALGKTGGHVARDALLQGTELSHPKARVAVVEALGKFRNDAKVLARLAVIVDKGDPSYRVEAAAITAWANQRPAGALTQLKALLGRESHTDMIRQAVLRGLARQRDAAALPLLLTWTDGAHPRRVRTTALDALSRVIETGDLTDAARKQLLDAVVACLHPHEHRRVKTSAAATLRTLGAHAGSAIDALEALADHDPHPRVRTNATETIEKIRSGAEPRLQLKGFRDELNKLRNENRALQRRIAKIEGQEEAKNYKRDE